MNKTALRYGLISSLLILVLMTPTWLLTIGNNSYTGSFAIGTAAMAVTLVPVIIAILKRRQHYGGTISFGNALLTALFVSLCATITYTLLWLVISEMHPEIVESMWSSYLKGLGKNVSTEDLEAFAELKENYNIPYIRAAYTMSEMAMYAVPVSLIGSLVLMKRNK